MTQTLTLIGNIEMVDMAAIWKLQGYNLLPYPFILTQLDPPVRDRMANVSDRLNNGDLRPFRTWTDTFNHADIWMEYRATFTAEDGPHARILAYRTDDLGFMASQHPSDDSINVFRVQPSTLASAVTEAVDLTKPGHRAEIVVPKYRDFFPCAATDEYAEEDEDEPFSVQISDRRDPSAYEVPDAEVIALATLQVHWQPARTWGPNWDNDVMAWVHGTDGEYVYTPDFRHAVPLTRGMLSNRVHGLVERNTAASRRHRGLS